VTRRKIKNVAASIRQRLLNEARASGRPFNELLQYFAIERFLYRLSRSPHAGRFVLKGALVLASWRVFPIRPTKDIGFLGHLRNDVDSVAATVMEICQQAVVEDGLSFDPYSVAGERIAEEAEYAGVRLRFHGRLGTARVVMQIDVGFGDEVVPGPVTIEYPTILDLPTPRILGYTKETVVAEKFHTMVRRGILNSRIRDFFDVWALSQQLDFDGPVLARAIRETFSRRETEVPARPVALERAFAEDPPKTTQWQGFLRKSRLEAAPNEFLEVIESLSDFLGPLAEALADGLDFESRSKAPGPWISPPFKGS